MIYPNTKPSSTINNKHICEPLPKSGSRLGQMFSYTAVPYLSFNYLTYDLSEFVYRSSPIDREDEPLFLHEVLSFDKPRYSRSFLYALHLIDLERDLKVLFAEQSLATIKKTFDEGQQALTDTLTPLRKQLKPSYVYSCGYSKPQSYAIATLRDVVQRFMGGIDDPEIAALYLSNLRQRSHSTKGRFTREQWCEWERQNLLKEYVHKSDGLIIRSFAEVLPDGLIVRRLEVKRV